MIKESVDIATLYKKVGFRGYGELGEISLNGTMGVNQRIRVGEPKSSDTSCDFQDSRH